MGRKKKDDTSEPAVTFGVTLPADLREAMREFDENWSACAAKCFRHRILELKANQETQGVRKKMIERLRASKAIAEGEFSEDGRQAGAEWAEQYASYAELKSLAVAFKEGQLVPDQWTGNQGFPGEVAKVATNDSMTCEEFWEQAIGDDWKELVYDRDDDEATAYMMGFLRAVAEQWDAVKDEL